MLVNYASGYIEEKHVNKYLISDSTDENKELLKKYNDVWSGIKNKIEEVSSGKCNYEKNYMKIKFNSDDDLPLKKPLIFHSVTITIRSVFEEYDRINILEGIDVKKTNRSKECNICHYWYFKNISFKHEPYLCNGCHNLMRKAMSVNNIAIVYINEWLIEFIFDI